MATLGRSLPLRTSVVKWSQEHELGKLRYINLEMSRGQKMQYHKYSRDKVPANPECALVLWKRYIDELSFTLRLGLWEVTTVLVSSAPAARLVLQYHDTVFTKETN
ncbi:hypothetical protein V2J09_021140 [Rumex salicifolius]